MASCRTGLIGITPEASEFGRTMALPPGTFGIDIPKTPVLRRSENIQRDLEINRLRAKIKEELNAFIRAERLETKYLEEETQKRGWLEKALIYTGAAMTGAIDATVGLADAVIAVAGIVAKGHVAAFEQAAEYIVDPLNAGETFENDLLAVESTFDDIQKSTKPYIEAYFILYNDPDSWQMLEDFAGDYIKAQHSTEWVKIAGESIPAIVITLLTGGLGGGAAAAATGSRMGQLAAKIGGMLRKLVHLLRKRPARRRARGNGGAGGYKFQPSAENRNVRSANTPNNPSRSAKREVAKPLEVRGVKNTKPKPVGKNTKPPKKFNTNPKDIRVAAQLWPAEKKARFDFADKFYNEAGYKDYDSHLRGIDFDKPVDIAKFSKGDKLYQYSYLDRMTGQPKVGSYYYGAKDVNVNKLGFDVDGRKMIEVKLDKSDSFLKSSAADIEDWNGSDKVFPGGETQLFNPSASYSSVEVIK